jgi:hypothetical protein
MSKQQFLFGTDPPPAARNTYQCRPGWERLAAGLNARYRLIGTDYYVFRQPHPTCLWPWAGRRDGGPLILAPSGRAFRLLQECQEAVEAIARA